MSAVYQAPFIYMGKCWKRAFESELRRTDRVWIVSDHESDLADKVSCVLPHRVDFACFSTSTRIHRGEIRKGMERLEAFRPDAIVGIGGESAMDASKLMRALYLDPQHDFRPRPFALSANRTRNKSNRRKRSVKLVCAPIACGTGSEVTPFATLHREGYVHGARVLDYTLTPDVAILDYELSETTPENAMHALARAIESYTSEYANEFTQGHSRISARLLTRSLLNQSTSKVHNALSLAGLASANARHSRTDSLAWALDELYQLPRGLGNAILLPHVIRNCPFLDSKHAELARHCEFTTEELAQGIEEIFRTYGVPERLRDLIPGNDLERVALLACYDSLQFGFQLHEPSVDFFRRVLQDAY
ncbi:MAG: iron-containing alcohol dehydrogenase [Flavobacteriia bacterium]|nr:iron-containing alcohol dehydrogenase [Flavobacteriia bacterium]